MVSKRPNKILVTVEFQGAKIIQAYDGETAWMINPMMGSAEPMDVTGPEADGLIESGDLDGQLWNYKEKGHQLELEGTEEVDGDEAYVLKLTKKNGNIDYYYMETESYLILKIKSKTIMNGSETEAEALLSNYQEVNGYVMAFTIEQKYGGQTAMTIMMDEVETNVEVDDSIFSKPAGN
jgi:outer membrane lipoprotein-sorting protein